jgi:hypothetical protein
MFSCTSVVHFSSEFNSFPIVGAQWTSALAIRDRNNQTPRSAPPFLQKRPAFGLDPMCLSLRRSSSSDRQLRKAMFTVDEAPERYPPAIRNAFMLPATPQTRRMEAFPKEVPCVGDESLGLSPPSGPSGSMSRWMRIGRQPGLWMMQHGDHHDHH